MQGLRGSGEGLALIPREEGALKGCVHRRGNLTQVATAGRTDLGARQGSGGTKAKGTVLVQAGNDGG